MDNMKIVYKILKVLESAMDHEEFDIYLISPEALDITKERRDKLLIQVIQYYCVSSLHFFCIITRKKTEKHIAAHAHVIGYTAASDSIV